MEFIGYICAAVLVTLFIVWVYFIVDRLINPHYVNKHGIIVDKRGNRVKGEWLDEKQVKAAKAMHRLSPGIIIKV